MLGNTHGMDGECDTFYEHAFMFGGTSRPTERDTPKLVTTILKGIRTYQRCPTVVEVNALKVGIGPRVDEEEQTAEWMNNEDKTEVEPEKVYKDAYTGAIQRIQGRRWRDQEAGA